MCQKMLGIEYPISKGEFDLMCNLIYELDYLHREVQNAFSEVVTAAALGHVTRDLVLDTYDNLTENSKAVMFDDPPVIDDAVQEEAMRKGLRTQLFYEKHPNGVAEHQKELCTTAQAIEENKEFPKHEGEFLPDGKWISKEYAFDVSRWK